MDSVRGAAFRIHSNLTAAQGGPDTNRFTSFDTDGFTIGSDPSVNQSGSGFVTWNWKANPVPTINTDGGNTVYCKRQSSMLDFQYCEVGRNQVVSHLLIVLDMVLSAAPEIIINKKINMELD